MKKKIWARLERATLVEEKNEKNEILTAINLSVEAIFFSFNFFYANYFCAF